MNKQHEKKQMPEDIREWLMTIPPDEDYSQLGTAIEELQDDPSFQSECLKADFVEMVLGALEQCNISKSELGRRAGMSRQQVNSMLSLKNPLNVTLETIARVTCALEKKAELLFCERDQQAQAYWPTIPEVYVAVSMPSGEERDITMNSASESYSESELLLEPAVA